MAHRPFDNKRAHYKSAVHFWGLDFLSVKRMGAWRLVGYLMTAAARGFWDCLGTGFNRCCFGTENWADFQMHASW